MNFFSGILCVNLKGVIGNNGDLLYRIPQDLSFFSSYTKLKVLLMGRGTADSLPHPLKNRVNLVLSRNEYKRDGFVTFDRIESVLDNWSEDKELVFIGGASLAEPLKPYISKWMVTIVHDDQDGDTKLPDGFFGGMDKVVNSTTTFNGFLVEFCTFYRK